MKAFHASKVRFDSFDLSKVGSGQEVNRYAHGIYLGEQKAVAKYLEDYAYLDAADTSICGNKGIAYSVNIPRSLKIVNWNGSVGTDLLNDVAIHLHDMFNESKLTLLEKDFVRAGLDLDCINDTDSMIDEIASKAYETMLEDDECESQVDEEMVKEFLLRKLRGDNYTSHDSDDDFKVHEKYLKLIKSFNDGMLSIEEDFTWGDLYTGVEQSLNQDNSLDTKKMASEILSQAANIDGFVAPTIHADKGSMELIIISQNALSRLKIKEISHEDLDSMTLDRDDRFVLEYEF